LLKGRLRQPLLEKAYTFFLKPRRLAVSAFGLFKHLQGDSMESWRQHLNLAARQLRRNPGFVLTVILTLALSIGANTAIFSLVNALMLRNPPYPHPERMGTIYTRMTGRNVSDARNRLDGEKWELLRDRVPALISAVSGGISGVNFQSPSGAQYVHDGRVSAHYFDVVGLHPLIGRNFSEDEDRPHGAQVTILTYNLWRNLFGAEGGVVGRTILLKGEAYMIVGVLPPTATTPLNADLYTPLQPSRGGEGSGTNFEVVTRLRNGATWQQADAEINLAWAQLAERFARGNPDTRITYHSVALQRGETDPFRPQALALMLAAGFILLIACANLAGLTIVRMLRRTSEVVTRLALGASPWQIRKQFWIENLLLALIGGAVGVGVGFVALHSLLLLMPEHFLPVASVPLDGRVLAFTLGVSLLTSILFGMLPTLATRKLNLSSSMADRTVASSGSVRLRQTLIAGEVALTVLLLAASGLLIRTLVHLEMLPPGFNPRGLLAGKASLDDARFHDPATFRKLLDASTMAMRQIPGVQSVSVGLSLPYERALNDGVTLSDGKETGRQDATDVVYVTPEYFETLQLPVLAGRMFNRADGPASQHVAVVNRAFAQRFYGGTNPVGRYINKDTLIVGEVADVSVSPGLDADAPLSSEQLMYIPAAQVSRQYLALVHVWFQPDWIVRTAGPIEGISAEMQRALASADPNVPFSGFYSMNDLMAQTLTTQRIEVALLGTMSALALLLSTLGIFALVSNIVAQRTREIGIRLALGSTVSNAMVQVGRSGAGASLTGILLGLMVSTGALRVLSSVLYGVRIYDGATLTAVVLTLLLVTLLATILPTWKIAKIDPANILRQE
jgi:macrolide transport system ATP-binding/permease protein